MTDLATLEAMATRWETQDLPKLDPKGFIYESLSGAIKEARTEIDERKEADA